MSNRWKCIATGSLMLNLLLGGVMLGYGWHTVEGRRPAPPPKEILNVLTPEHREAYEKVMQQMKEESDAVRAQMRDVREESLMLLAADSFDETAYSAAMEKMHMLRNQRKERMADAVKELARSWPVHERAALAEALRHPPGKEGRCPPPPREAPPAPNDREPPPAMQ